ncbi:MAG: acetyltransferase [Bacteroidales bacterium]|nr:acetyltransferase [Bacteroidales bacterium]
MTETFKFRYKLLKGWLWTIGILPFPVLYALSDFLCFFVRRIYRTKVVRDNLRTAFPDKSDAELKEIEIKFYHQFCDNWVEVIKMLVMDREEIMRRMKYKGIDEVKKKFEETGKQFNFFYLAHFGNWEWLACLNHWLQPEARSGQIYHHVYNRFMNQLLLDLRDQYGGVSIEMKETFRRILQMRGDGTNYMIGFISDQQPKWNSIHHFVPFLNHDTAVFIGAEHIGRKVDAFFTYGRMTRPKRGYYEIELIHMADSANDLPENTLTNEFFRLLEEDIQSHPEMWLWTHKRWSRTKEEWLRRQAEGIK